MKEVGGGGFEAGVVSFLSMITPHPPLSVFWIEGGGLECVYVRWWIWREGGDSV